VALEAWRPSLGARDQQPRQFSGIRSEPPIGTPWRAFPGVFFNPTARPVPGLPAAVTDYSRPFQHVTLDGAGAFTGSIVAEGNGVQAGAGPLFHFAAIMTGSISVPAAGEVTLALTAADGVVMGIGGGAVRVSGPAVNAPAATVLQALPVMGANNTKTAAPVVSTMVVRFPAAGTYPFEIDYAKGGDNRLTLVLRQAPTAGAPIVVPAEYSLTLAPNTMPTALPATVRTFTATLSRSNGTLLPATGVALAVTGTNAQVRNDVTNGVGQVSFSYRGTVAGADTVQASATVAGQTVMSNAVRVLWNNGTNQAPTVAIPTQMTVVMPGAAALSAIVSDDGLPANTLTTAWTRLSGPGTVTFDAPAQAVTAATFSAPGSYVLQVSVSDGALSTVRVVNVTVEPPTLVSGNWLATPLDGVTEPVPVNLVPGITLVSGVLRVYPASDANAATIINGSTVGAGGLGTLDPTLLANGAYWVELRGTNTAGVTQTNLALVTVSSDNKPGRVTIEVVDLELPLPGISLSLTRRYDSLERSIKGDFGPGWSMMVRTRLEVAPSGNVSLNLDGRRQSFFFAPPPNPIFVYWFTPKYVADRGTRGTLESTGDNCNSVLVRTGRNWRGVFRERIPIHGPIWKDLCYQRRGRSGFPDRPQWEYADPHGRRHNRHRRHPSSVRPRCERQHH
jgi:hypothetical protein